MKWIILALFFSVYADGAMVIFAFGPLALQENLDITRTVMIIERIASHQKDPNSFVREITAPLGKYFKLNRREWKGGRNGF